MSVGGGRGPVEVEVEVEDKGRQDATTRDTVERIVRTSAPGNAACTVGRLRPYECALTVGSGEGERLEFLGDAIIGAVIAEYLFERFPGEREGFLTRMRSKLVSGTMLAKLAYLLSLQKHLRWQARPGAIGAVDERVMEDRFEAFVGAMSVDVGIVATRVWLRTFIEARIDVSALVSHHDTNKERLATVAGRESAGSRKRPVYTGTWSGDGTVSVCVRDGSGRVIGTATARTRKAAEEEAARRALTLFERRGSGHVLPREAVGTRIRR